MIIFINQKNLLICLLNISSSKIFTQVFSSKAMQCWSTVILSFAISVTTIVAWYLSDMFAIIKSPVIAVFYLKPGKGALTMKIYSYR